MKTLIESISAFFTPELAKASMVLALVFTSVVIGLFIYLGRSTKREHFKLWSVAWMFYAVYLATLLGVIESPHTMILDVAQLACVGVSALFLFWGSFRLIDSPRFQRELVLALIMIVVWSAAAVYTLRDSLWGTSPVFVLLAGANWYTGLLYLRGRDRNRGRLILATAFFLWGLSVFSFPFLGHSPTAMTIGYSLSAIFPLLVALGAIVDEEVRASEQTYRAVFDAAKDAIFMVDLYSLKVLEANVAAQQLTQRSPTELAGLSFHELCPNLRNEDTAKMDHQKMFASTFRPYSQLPVLRSNGTSVSCEGDTRLVQWRSQPALQINVREVDTSGKVGQQLRRGEKLSALGQLIAGVAHELNNPLAIVMGYSQLLSRQKNITDKTRQEVLKILQESERAAKIVRNLLTFVRPCEPQMVPLDINQLISNLLEIRENELLEGKIQIERKFAPDLPRTKADPQQIEQVLTNVITNAIQAMTAGSHQLRILTVATQENGFSLRITISDTGPGISDQIVGKIFDPFFTTRDPGKGTGLGLTICNSIIQEHGGKIWVESKMGRGSDFFVELPLIPCEEKPEKPLAASVDDQRTVESRVPQHRVLIVDDEPGILSVLEEVLGASGYQIDTAGNGAEAIRRISDRPYDLIITDLCMPEVDGQQLYKTIRDRFPDLVCRIVFLTGDTISSKSRDFLEETGSRWFSKPFSVVDIEKFVHDFLRNHTPVAGGTAGRSNGGETSGVDTSVQQFAS